MYKLVVSLIVAVLFFTTLCICIKKPQMHKSVMIYNSDYEIVPVQNNTEQPKNIPTIINLPAESQKTNLVEKVQNEEIIQIQNTQPKTIKSVEKQVNETKVVKQENKKFNSPIETEKQTTIVLPESVKKIINNETASTTKKEVTTQKVKPKEITEEEKLQQELVLWNKWRSRIQNQIMTDVILPIVPEGTIFSFSFDVDKFGRISNIHTSASNPMFTAYAIQYIAPVIRSYQGKSILEFPSGSNRVSTTVEGNWRIAKTTKLSTPNDYNDTERINK